jgi:hypothetical protein
MSVTFSAARQRSRRQSHSMANRHGHIGGRHHAPVSEVTLDRGGIHTYWPVLAIPVASEDTSSALSGGRRNTSATVTVGALRAIHSSVTGRPTEKGVLA